MDAGKIGRKMLFPVVKNAKQSFLLPSLNKDATCFEAEIVVIKGDQMAIKITLRLSKNDRNNI